MGKIWINRTTLNEKIVIKKENTTTPNVKEKPKKDGEKEKQERERREKNRWETTRITKVALGGEY